MGVIDKFINNFKSRNAKFKEYQEDERIQRQLSERKLSHNERILNKLLEEERQKQIRNQLDFMVKKRKMEDLNKQRNFMKFNQEWFNNNSILNQKNVFKSSGGF